jgi:chromate transport protein ChrA
VSPVVVPLPVHRRPAFDPLRLEVERTVVVHIARRVTFMDVLSYWRMISPGPVVITATFVGYLVAARIGGSLLAGFRGSLVSTIGVFLPSFLLILIVAPILVRFVVLFRWKVGNPVLVAGTAVIA